MTDLYSTGIRPIIDNHLLDLAAQRRDYGEYWSASSAGYCMRKVMFDRMGVPEVNPDPRKQRVFTAGHIFHDWIQEQTRNAGVSIAQEVELIDDELHIKGHFDDLVLIKGDNWDWDAMEVSGETPPIDAINDERLILYDYKTVNSRSFMWAKKQLKETGENPMSHFHRLQLGTYMYMLRSLKWVQVEDFTNDTIALIKDLTESRILKLEKDTLMMSEQQLMWSPQLEKDVYEYWSTLNGYWEAQKLPACTCEKFENGFMAKEAYNPYFYGDEPCSLDWFKLQKKEHKIPFYEVKK